MSCGKHYWVIARVPCAVEKDGSLSVHGALYVFCMMFSGLSFFLQPEAGLDPKEVAGHPCEG